MNAKVVNRKLVFSLMSLGLLGFSSSSAALTIGNFTTIGTTEGSINNVSATALFDLTGSVLTLTLTNTTGTTTVTDPIDRIVEILDGFQFTISTGGSSLALSSATAQGGVYDCTGSACSQTIVGPITDLTGPKMFDSYDTVNNTNKKGWSYDGSVSPSLLAAGMGSFKPLGITNSGMTKADGLPNDQHNPYLAGPVSFLFNYTGQVANPTIGNVRFAWGTEPAWTTPGGGGPPTEVPEPASLGLLGLGLLAIGAIRRRKVALKS